MRASHARVVSFDLRFSPRCPSDRSISNNSESNPGHAYARDSDETAGFRRTVFLRFQNLHARKAIAGAANDAAKPGLNSGSRRVVATVNFTFAHRSAIRPNAELCCASIDGHVPGVGSKSVHRPSI